MKFFHKRYLLPATCYKSRGYTIVETLVAMGVFLVITTVAVGGFVRALYYHRQALALTAVNSNASAVIEQMAREIRTGTDFNILASSLNFDNALNEAVTYDLAGGSVIRSASSPPEAITDTNVIVEYLNFEYLQIASYPPRIIINLGVRTQSSSSNSGVVHLQTTVSGRNF